MGSDNLMQRIWQGCWMTLPLYPWYSSSSKQILNKNVFREMRDTHTSWKMLNKMLDDFHELRNKYINQNLVNSEIFLVREDQRFSFGIYDNEFNLWDDSQRFLGSYKIDDLELVPSKEFCDWIEELTEDYCQGFINCSDCGSKISKKDIAGNYFAGVYCKDCWESRWKAIEAKESYD